MTTSNEATNVIPYSDGITLLGNNDATTLSTGAARFNVGFIPEGSEARKVCNGPMVPGPWAYAFALCTVIDNHGGTGAENARAKAAARWLDVADGDSIEVCGHQFTVAFTDGYSQRGIPGAGRHIALKKID